MATVPSTPTSSPRHTVHLWAANRPRLHVPVITQHMQHSSSHLQHLFLFQNIHRRAYTTNAGGHTVLDTCEIHEQGTGLRQGAAKESPRCPRRSHPTVGSRCKWPVLLEIHCSVSLYPVLRVSHHHVHASMVYICAVENALVLYHSYLSHLERRFHVYVLDN